MLTRFCPKTRPNYGPPCVYVHFLKANMVPFMDGRCRLRWRRKRCSSATFDVQVTRLGSVGSPCQWFAILQLGKSDPYYVCGSKREDYPLWITTRGESGANYLNESRFTFKSSRNYRRKFCIPRTGDSDQAFGSVFSLLRNNSDILCVTLFIFITFFLSGQ